MIDLSLSQLRELKLYRDRLARVTKGEVWGSDHPGPYTDEEKAKEIVRIGAIIRGMEPDLKGLLMRVSEITTVEEFKANLDELSAQCEQDYALAEQSNIDNKAELMARVAHARTVFAAMVQALAEREAAQGIWRKWSASNRATRACITMRSAQALVRIALREVEDRTMTSMGIDPRHPQFGWMHRYSEAETFLL